ncbi:MAG: LysR family transcriptional regulator [Amphritea sp.]
MDTHTLQAFVTVAESGSFSIAAQQLFLTQSAVSKRIAQLEDQLDSRLFDRIGRKITLTEPGATLLPKARKILLELKDAKRSLSNLSGEVSGTLAVAASHHISLHRLPPILRRFTHDYPEVQLDLRFKESEIAYDGVLRGDIEIALITLSPHPDKNIKSDTIWNDRLCYVVANDHPLASKPEISLEELTGYNAILSGRSTFTRQIVEDQFARLGLELNVSMSTNYLDTIRMMVEVGLGWSLLPETMTASGLTTLEVEAEPVTRYLGYITHRERTLSNAARRFIEMLKDEKGS